jgi:chromosome segregation ATPase
MAEAPYLILGAPPSEGRSGSSLSGGAHDAAAAARELKHGLEFQRLIEGAARAAGGDIREADAIPTGLGRQTAHFAANDSVMHDSMHILRSSQRSSPERAGSRARHHGGDGSSAVGRLSSEIDVLRATQAARDVLASKRSRSDSAWKPDLEVKADGPEDQLFSELGYLRQERDLVVKEKKALQHLLVQAGEEIRVLVQAEQRHVEELRGWVRQRDELLKEKAQAEQTASLCHGLRLRLEEVLSQHRNDKCSWEEEVRGLLRDKACSDSAADAARKEVDALKTEQQTLQNERASAYNAKVAAENDLVGIRAMLSQRDEKIALLERERDRLVQENCSCR